MIFHSRSLFSVALSLGLALAPLQSRAAASVCEDHFSFGAKSLGKKIDLFETYSMMNGQKLLRVKSFIEKSKMAEARDLRKKFEKLNFAKGLRPRQVNELFDRVYDLSNSDPITWKALLDQPMSVTRRQVIRREVYRKLGKEALTKAFTDLTYIGDASKLDLAKDWAMQMPNVVETATAGSVFVLNSIIPVGIMHIPEFQKLKQIKIPDYLKTKILNEGFDAAYPELKVLYGKKAGFDVKYRYAKQVFIIGMTVMFVAWFSKALLLAAMPPGYETDPGKNHFEIAKDAYFYWARTVAGALRLNPPEDFKTAAQEKSGNSTKNSVSANSIASNSPGPNPSSKEQPPIPTEKQLFDAANAIDAIDSNHY
jgi:hypothetical protein